MFYQFFCLSDVTAQRGSGPPQFLRFLDHRQRHTTVGRTPLEEGSASCRDLYLTTQNTHKGQTSMPPEEFETAIIASEQPQTFALGRSDRLFCRTKFLSALRLRGWSLKYTESKTYPQFRMTY